MDRDPGPVDVGHQLRGHTVGTEELGGNRGGRPVEVQPAVHRLEPPGVGGTGSRNDVETLRCRAVVAAELVAGVDRRGREVHPPVHRLQLVPSRVGRAVAIEIGKQLDGGAVGTPQATSGVGECGDEVEPSVHHLECVRVGWDGVGFLSLGNRHPRSNGYSHGHEQRNSGENESRSCTHNDTSRVYCPPAHQEASTPLSSMDCRSRLSD